MPRPRIRDLKTQIGRQLRRHLADLGLVRTLQGHLTPPSKAKDALRALHASQRSAVLHRERRFIEETWPLVRKYFADGWEIDPAGISPRLEPLEAGSWQSNLFRFAALTWSIPVSAGYGRRMRFLVWDDANRKLLGLIALGDPVFNLTVRDEWIGWNVEDRKERLVNVLDAYVLGAVPPYNWILGGKLVAALVRTVEIRDCFADRYASSRGIISRRKKRPTLVMVTTASAFGRSSVYNRLRIGEQVFFQPVGFTKGYGHFHIPDDLFDLIRGYLKAKRHAYSSNFKFGEGPNWRMRAVREALVLAGLNPKLLRHGVQRQVFASELATNARAVLRGDERTPDYGTLTTIANVSERALDRWVIPRARADSTYLEWTHDNILALLQPGQTYRVLSTARMRTGTDGAR
jgi:hypothetical protein